MATALVRGIREILRRLLKRRLRTNPRVVKRKMSNYMAKHSNHRAWPQPTQPPCDTIKIAKRLRI
jgi:hypothetical protein